MSVIALLVGPIVASVFCVASYAIARVPHRLLGWNGKLAAAGVVTTKDSSSGEVVVKDEAPMWLHELVEELESARDPAERMAVVNHALDQRQRELDAFEIWPRGALGIAAAGGLLAVMVGWTAGGVVGLVASAPIAATGVAAAFFARGTLRNAIVRHRALVDRTVAALVGDLAGVELELPRRRSRERHARRDSRRRSRALSMRVRGG
ncbi:MAG: hypothetical protein EXR75_02330 [Myxococcales bacterium]|nr:hypothetical protein [Myxococcales bacterium]